LRGRASASQGGAFRAKSEKVNGAEDGAILFFHPAKFGRMQQERKMDNKNNVTELQDAKALKRMHLPLNTPMEHREFSSEYTRHWVALLEAYAGFMVAVIKYSGTTSEAKWRTVVRRYNELVTLTEKEPPFKDENERVILAMFKEMRAIPFLEYWGDLIDAVEDGVEGLVIKPGDAPLWTHPE
jgi:hypothetical protein